MPADRENYKNTRILRNWFKTLILKRKAVSSEELMTKGDFLSILLTDELFTNNEDLILDECLTFFFAGS